MCRPHAVNALYELDPEIGRRIARGEDVEILPQHLQRVNPQYGYDFENGSGTQQKDAAIVDIQLQRTLNSVQMRQEAVMCFTF